MADKPSENEVPTDEESLGTVTEDRRKDDRRQDRRERRCGMDRRNEFDGSEFVEQRSGVERRQNWDRRRGPGRRRTDARRAAEEGEMNDEQFEFLKAIEEYKKVNRKPFPSFTEVLEIALALGYRKVAEPISLEELGKEADDDDDFGDDMD